jgi:hypothetical protein
MLNPIEALHQVIGYAFVRMDQFGPKHRLGRPGQVILHLPKEIREPLQKLTSDEVSRIRFK